MVNGVSGSTQSIEQLKARMEALRTEKDSANNDKVSAESSKSGAEATQSSAEQTNTNAITAKDIATAQKQLADEAVSTAEAALGMADSRLKTADSEVSGALSVLQSAQSADPQNPSTIASAQAAYDRAIKNQEEAQKAYKEAKEAKDEAVDAQTKAQEALDKATQEADDAAAALQDARDALDKAITELEEAVDALEEAEDQLVEAEKEVKEAEELASQPIMSEEQAIKDGYTIIKSYDDLLKIGNDLSGKYMLMGDVKIPEGINWTPIGDANSPFKGEFNGNGCKISGLNINVEGDEVENVGFFGVTDGAKISDVTFVDAKINGKTDYLTGTNNAGVLAGLVKNSTIDNCHVKGGEVSAYSAAGGLIGAVDDRDFETGVSNGNTSISHCTTDVDVESMFFAGGLIGYVNGCDDRSEDHRGIVNKSLMIRDCHTSGSATAGEESVGGLIGETDKTLVTLDKCSSDMDLYWSNSEDDSDLSFLLETGRIGGLVGNVNGTYITFANCEFGGTLNGDTEFQSEVYGWYMDDAHVCIYDLPDGLPIDDILNISGIDGMKLNSDGKYECTVSTLAGLDKMVAMIKENPSLADQVVFNVNFDFNAMDGAYTYSEYAQYGIVQHLYEDEEGNVHNDVYIDNECDLESTYHATEPKKMQKMQMEPGKCQPKECKGTQVAPTMVSGLYRSTDKTMIPGLDTDGYKYYVDTKEGLKEVTLKINADGQITDVQTRLTESEVRYRDRLAELGKSIQQQMRDVLKDMYKWNSDESVPVLTKAEYKKLLKKAEKNGYDSLTDKEKLGMAVFEADYDIMNAQAKYTKNLGCGMGGNASFLDKTTTHQMYDDQGRALYTTLDGDSLIKDENGNYAYADGSGAYYGMAEVFEQRGYQTTDKDGNLLFSDADGKTVTQIKGEDGATSYVTTDENGEQVAYEGDVEALKKQLTPTNYADDYESFAKDLNQILQDVKDGKYPKERTSTDNTEEGTPTDGADGNIDGGKSGEADEGEAAENVGDVDGDGDVDGEDIEKKIKEEE